MKQAAKYRCGFYYDQLDIDHQVMYRRIASAVSYFENEVVMDTEDKMLYKTELAVRYDNPELCYWSVDASNTDNGKLNLNYTVESVEEAEDLVKQLKQKRKEIFEELFTDEKITETERISRVYDYMVRTVDYAEEELQKPGSAQSIYEICGPLLKNRGVCLGIAQSFNYLCQALHTDSILITGEARIAGWTGNHGWNLVRIGDQYYHMDITSEICDNSDESGRKYFMKKDKDLKDRKWPENLYPKAV